jgi:hypothetical protein
MFPFEKGNFKKELVGTEGTRGNWQNSVSSLSSYEFPEFLSYKFLQFP